MICNNDKLYLFGAGNNGRNIISFIGKEKIIAIVDNRENVVGEKICNIDIISFECFLQKYSNETVLITSVYFASDIEKQLLNAGIENICKCPFITSEMVDTDKWIKDLIRKYKIFDMSGIFIYPLNPLTRCIEEKLKRQNYKGEIDFLDKVEDINKWIDKKSNTSILILFENENHISGKNIINLIDGEYDEQNFSALKKYKNMYEGDKCFVIGNGPSLISDDLDVLQEKGIVSFGCNGIYKIFNQTCWRPTYYFWGDPDAFRSNGCILENQKYFMSDLFRCLNLENPNIEYFHHIFLLKEGVPLFSEDIVSGVSGGRTVTFPMLQFAVYMGFKEIYLLGVDFTWGEDGRKTHFCDEYVDAKYEKKIRGDIMYKNGLLKTYGSAKKYAQEHGIQIYNATRGGNLELFERIDFDSLFG